MTFRKRLNLILSTWVFCLIGAISYDVYILVQANAIQMLTWRDTINLVFRNMAIFSLPFAILTIAICAMRKFKNKR